MSSMYSKAKVCSYKEPNNCDLSLEPGTLAQANSCSAAQHNRVSLGLVRTQCNPQTGEVGWGGVDWIGLAQDRDKRRALVHFVTHEMLGNYGVASQLVTSRAVLSSMEVFLSVMSLYACVPCYMSVPWRSIQLHTVTLSAGRAIIMLQRIAFALRPRDRTLHTVDIKNWRFSRKRP
jgi:hypothetical protein